MPVIVREGVGNKTAHIVMPLYKSVAQPRFEYCVTFWSPHLEKDIAELEKLQKRASAMIQGMGGRGLPRRKVMQHLR